MIKATTFALLVFFSVSLIAQNSSNKGDLTWFWSANNCAEYGTFTTDGVASDTTSSHTFTLKTINVYNSTVLPDAGQWSFTISQPDIGFHWNGTKIDTCWRLSGIYTNGASFEYTNNVDTTIFWGFNPQELYIYDENTINYDYLDLKIVADTNAGCGATSMKDNLSDNIIIYPNPTSDFVEISNIPNYNIKIFSIAGVLIKQIENKSNKIKIDFTNQEKGVYLIQFYQDEKIITNKVIIKQ